MIIKLLNTAAIAALPAAGGQLNNNPIEARTPKDKKSWVVIWNLSNWLFEVWDDQGSIRAIAWPGFTPVKIQVATERLYLNAVSLLTGSIPLPAGGQAVYYDVTDVEPLVGAPFMPIGTAAAPQLVRLEDGITTNLALLASAANLAAQSSAGAIQAAPPGQWSVQHSPAAGVQATISKASGGAGVRNVCTGFGFGFSAGVAIVATTVVVNLRDGASGAGTILKSWEFSLPAAIIAPFGIEVAGCEIPGSAATAMTIEFTALLANLVEYVNLAGHLAS